MNRVFPWPALGLSILGGVCAGCLNKADVPYLGRWEGRYTVESVDPKLPIPAPARNALRGFLQLYRTDNRCTLQLDGEQEGVEVKGHWALKKHEIVLTFRGRSDDAIKIDDAGGIDLRDPRKAFIPPSDLAAAYSAPLALHIGPDNQSLSSPLIVIGPLTGHYEFKKESLGRG